LLAPFIESDAISSQATKQGLSSRGVKSLHAAQMAKIVPFPQEFRHNSALYGRSRRRPPGKQRTRRNRTTPVPGGTTMKPRRSAGLIVLLKLPMCSTRPA